MKNRDGRLVSIGKITGVHGIRGALKIQSYAESLDLFKGKQGVQLEYPGGEQRPATVTEVKPHGRRLLVTLEGVGDREQAAALVGALIRIPRHHLPELDDGTYYWADLMGCDVYTAEDLYLGRVHAVISAAGNDVLVVRSQADDSGSEILIPAVAAVCTGVDLIGRRLTVNLPEGL